MSTPIRHLLGSLEAAGAVASIVDADGAYMEFDSGTSFAHFGAKGTAGTSRGVKIRTLNAGSSVDAVSYAADGTPTFVKGLGLPGASVASIDTSSSSMTIANNGTQSVATGAYGFVVLRDVTFTGDSCIILITNSVASIVYQNSTSFSAAAGTGGKTNVYVSAGNLLVENKLGSSATYRALVTAG